ncbi:MAG: MBL fold metallo-hydrolase [Actinomycetota bacterium]|nr:MBL fold metallo-hydrolase [Actinomycetota bacterium]
MDTDAPSDDRLYFRQLLAGRDFASANPLARQMVNFTYLIGDRQTGEVVVVDPAYDVDTLLDAIEEDGMCLGGVLVTHYHPDHVGGSIFGHSIEGVAKLLERVQVPIHVQSVEADGVLKVTGISDSDLVKHSGGDRVTVGEIPIELIHTPGHTPGSQCFLLDRQLVAGDTLFLEGCGRVDLPGGDAEALYHSIHSTLSRVDDDVVLYPGHLYAPEPSAPMGDVRKTNFVYRLGTLDQWKMMMGS